MTSLCVCYWRLVSLFSDSLTYVCVCMCMRGEIIAPFMEEIIGYNGRGDSGDGYGARLPGILKMFLLRAEIYRPFFVRFLIGCRTF